MPPPLRPRIWTFKRHQVSMQRWIVPRFGWLIREERGWGRGPHLPDFQAQHTKNWAQIEAGYEKWRLPDQEVAPPSTRGTS